ncbi:SusC/RagA family TonB-linked outer membrane protein [Pedobacter jejuensis]|uniref:TonB-dependent receptor n=1 Tax=Pedobacter jejuensis TaxID=1268550 RepID=A0A3N0C2Y7_9SPHI|nr:TonB-dependent receptor [Pedobacter jejuensis]RNL56643.1 TonB-dependent receptor [Pedobacter jejuensis]
MKNLLNKTWIVYLFFLTALVLTIPEAYSQAVQKTIRGKVISDDNSKDAIPGVSISLKAKKTQLAVTDAAGNYSVRASVGDVLVFTYVGAQPKEITVGNQDVVNITLSMAVNNLNDVVVVGYGTALRKDLTGSVSSIKAEDIAKSAATTFDQALQGRVAGVVINTNSGQPGGGISVQIRGVSTLGGNQEPLYVVDGVFYGGDVNGAIYTGGSPGTNPLATISPSDIESIDILKDASATAIYGSQASNGVVIVTTKKGKSGPPKISIDASYGIQQLPKYLPVMELPEYAAFRNVRDVLNGAVPNPLFADPSVLGQGTNWQKAIFGTAPVQNYNLSVNGGDTRTNYILNVGYLSQDGIAIKSDFKRYNVRLNVETKATSWLKLATNISGNRINENINNQDGNLVQLAIRQSPDIAVINPDGTYGGPSSSLFTLTNPFALTEINTNTRTRSEVYGSAYADITFLKDFVLRNEIAVNYNFGQIEQFEPAYQFGQFPKTNSFGRRGTTAYNNNTFRTYLSYNHTFASKYKLNGTLGHESRLNTSSFVDATATGYFQTTNSELNLGDPTKATSTSGKSQQAIDSYYGRFNFTYDDKYTLTSTVRYDGSSKFSPENRWNFTYAFALAYRLKQETFMKSVDFISDLKLRLGYGLVNNQNISDYVYGTSYRTTQTALGLGVLLDNVPNPDAKWETTKSSNVGIDASFFKDRLQFTVDAYYKNTNNLLNSLSLPLYSGTTPQDQFTVAKLNAPTKNVGSIVNKGIEFSINSVNVKGKDFTWTTNVTLSRNLNKVTSLITENTNLPQYLGTDIVQQVTVGRSIGEFYGFIADGVFKDGADLTNSASQGTIGVNGVWVGDIKFRDLNGDKIIDNKDLTYLGSPLPKFQYGFSNTFKYKAFDITVFFNGNYGNKIFNQLKRTNEDLQSGFGLLQSVNDYARIGLRNPAGSAADINNVFITNPNTTVPRISTSTLNNNNRVSTRYIEDGSYLRLKNLVVGYSFPSKLVQKIKLSYFRVYGNVTNLFTITDYTGYDPEVGSRFQNAQSAGVDNGRYPSSRTYTFGIYAGF